MTSSDRGQRLRFAVPASLGVDIATRAALLETLLRSKIAREADVVVAQSYEHMARDILSGAVDAAWAPPFVCARVEAMGVRILVRGIRHGASVYRSALVCRSESPLEIQTLAGTKAAWSDRDSVGGYLLPMALLKASGINPSRCFTDQQFVGSYRKALEAVDAGTADVTALFAAVPRPGQADTTGMSEIWPERASQFRVIAFTDEAPNDGVAVSMTSPAPLVNAIEKIFLEMAQSSDGRAVLEQCFHADRFERAPRMSYRSLYRIALASL